MATKNVPFVWHSLDEEPEPDNGRKTYLVQLLWTEMDGVHEAVCTTVARFQFVYNDETGTVEGPRWIMPGTGPDDAEVPLDCLVAWGEVPDVMSVAKGVFNWGYLSPSEFFEIIDSY